MRLCADPTPEGGKGVKHSLKVLEAFATRWLTRCTGGKNFCSSGSGIFRHSNSNKSSMLSPHEAYEQEKLAGNAGQGFRHSKEPRQKLGFWFVKDQHPNHQVWALLLAQS